MDFNNISFEKCLNSFGNCLNHISDTLLSIINQVSSTEMGLTLPILIGVILGFILNASKITSFEKVAGFSIFKDTILLKITLLSIAFSSLGLYFMIEFGYASEYNKELYLISVVPFLIGAVLFGIGATLLGQTPISAVASLGSGRVDMIFGILGGFLASYLILTNYSSIFIGFDSISLSLFDVVNSQSLNTQDILIFYSITFMVLSIIIPTKEYKDEVDMLIDELNSRELQPIDLDSEITIIDNQEESKTKKDTKKIETDEFFV
jgi:uncharacterized membrane protein YedE/YeeE